MGKIKIKYEVNILRDVRNIWGNISIGAMTLYGMRSFVETLVEEEMSLMGIFLSFSGIVILFVIIIDSIILLVNVNMHKENSVQRKVLLVSEMLNWADWINLSDYNSGYDEWKEIWEIYEQNIQEYIPESYVDFEPEDARGELSERQLQCILRIYHILYENESKKEDRFREIFEQFLVYLREYRKAQNHYMSVTEIRVLNTILKITSYHLLQ